MMVCTEGNTNRECYYWGGLGGMEENKKSALPKKTAAMGSRIVSCSSTSG